jgi:hypothetical protein
MSAVSGLAGHNDGYHPAQPRLRPIRREVGASSELCRVAEALVAAIAHDGLVLLEVTRAL